MRAGNPSSYLLSLTKSFQLINDIRKPNKQQITIKACIQILKQNHTYIINHRKYVIRSQKGKKKDGVKEGKSRYLLVQNIDPTSMSLDLR